MAETNDFATTILNMDIDQILESDYIASCIYDRFVTVNGVDGTPERNEFIELILKVARIIINKAAGDKHPEIKFIEKYVSFIEDATHDSAADLEVYLAIRTMLHLCIELPKNMERFDEMIHYQLMQWNTNNGIFATFERLEGEIKAKGYSYVFSDLAGINHTAKKDYATMDWMTITNGYEFRDIEAFVLNPEVDPEERWTVLMAIEARLKYDSDKTPGLMYDPSYFRHLEELVQLSLQGKPTDEVDGLKLEVQELTEKLKSKDADINTLKVTIEQNKKTIEEADMHIGRLTSDLAFYAEKSQELENETEAKDDEPGHRTRRVASAALHEIIKPLLTANGAKTYNYKDEAALVEYFTNFSLSKIQHKISHPYSFTEKQKDEIERVNDMFNKLGINIELKYSEK